MNPERWAQIKEIYLAALDLSAADRLAFLDRTCGADESLRHEVARLLEHSRETFTEELAQDLSGRTISHYRLLARVGEGGMGVVYKAEDTRLHRTVALKFLRPNHTSIRELKLRFLQEARAAALLDHPNICTVHSIEEAQGHTFLVMSWVPGESLAERTRHGPLPFAEIVDIASEIAEGLRAAHEHGVVHRDVKTANVMLTEKRQVKLMDFGLALLADDARITTAGTIMGTPAYMSPEQLRGEETDNRTDIWSLGIVIYELVTGRLPFRGDTAIVVAAAIQNVEPEPATRLRDDVPFELDFVLSKALAKDKAERYQRMDELLIDLRRMVRRSGTGNPQAVVKIPASRWQQVIAMGLAVAVFALAFGYIRPDRAIPANAAVRRFAVTAPAPVRSNWDGRNVAVSPDGRYIAMAGSGDAGKLWIQDLSRWRPLSIDGTEGASMPFWSPDSRYVGFASPAGLMKVRLDGGTPVRICELPSPRFHGAAWSFDAESIVFASNELFEVPASGGTAKPITLPDPSIERKLHPWFLPSANGDRVIAFAGGSGSYKIYVYNLKTGYLKSLVPGSKPTYSPEGYLIYQATEVVRELLALPFSVEMMQATGKPFIVAQPALEPTAATDGTLVYRQPRRIGLGRFQWFDRNGREQQTIELQGVSNQYRPQLSPDGKFIGFLGRESAEAELSVWLYDFLRGRSTRLTSGSGRELMAVWSPSGEYVAFSSNRTGTFRIYTRRTDGSGEVTPLTNWGNNFVTDWSRDGKYLLFEETSSRPSGDLWFLERNSDGGAWQAKPYLTASYGERFGKFSPNGRYVAYLSSETGREQVYVRTFPEGSSQWTISTAAASVPVWRADGRELFYHSEGAIMSVPVSTEGTFRMGTPVRLFATTRYFFDVSADGKRFLIALSEEDAVEPAVRVVQNWSAEFRQR